MSSSEEAGAKLYVGVDDSNHAGANKKGEVLVAIFSYDARAGYVNFQPSRRDVQKVHAFLSQPGNDYRFTILSDDESRHRGYNVALVAPLLLRHYLQDHEPVREIVLACDGPLRGNQKRYLRDSFPEREVHAEGFIKKVHRPNGKLQPGLHCPYVVVAADTLAHWMYGSLSLESLLGNPRMVPISQEELRACDKIICSGTVHPS